MEMELAFTNPIQQKVKSIWQQLNGVMQLGGAVVHGFRLAHKYDALKQPGQAHHQPAVAEFCRTLCNALGMELKWYGEIPKDPALWVSNHISWADIAVIGSLVPAFFLAKAEVKKWPILGQLATVGGTLYIKRGSGDSGSVTRQLAELLKQKISIIIFPEATTSNGRFIKKVHGRLLVAAGAANCPVQPVVIAYTTPEGKLDDAVPYIDDQSIVTNLQQVLKAAKPITAHLMVLPAIDPLGKTGEQITSELQQALEKGLTELHRKILN